MSENVTIKAEKKQDAKKKGGERKKTEECVSSSRVPAKQRPIKSLLLLLRCLSEKNSVAMKGHK